MERESASMFAEALESSPQPESTSKKAEARPASVLEKLRNLWRDSPGIRPVIIALGLEAASFGPHVAEKLKEHVDIQADLQTVETEDQQLEADQEKFERLHEMFGSFSPFSFEDKKLRVDEQRSRLEQEMQSFSFFKGASSERSVVNKWVERLIAHESDPEKSKPDSLQTTPVETKTGTFDEKEIRELLVTTYPKGWVENEVSSIEQVGESQKMPERYGTGGEVAGICAGGQGKERSQIVLLRPTRSDDAKYVLNDLIPHELGHANDWNNDSEMTSAERVNLLISVGERLDDSDRFRSWYVEHIQNKDGQHERYTRATEYWAEICAAYFSTPDFMNIKDFELVDGVVKKGDPKYNLRFNNSQRAQRENLVIEDRVADQEPSQP